MYKPINSRKELIKTLKEISATCRFFRMRPKEGEYNRFRVQFHNSLRKSIMPPTYIVQQADSKWHIYCNSHHVTSHENQYECIRKFTDLYREFGNRVWRPDLDNR